MRTTIIGLFDSEQTALTLANEILERGIDSDQVETLTWRSLSEGSDPWGIGQARNKGAVPGQRLVDHLVAHGVPEDDARDFAEAVRRGGNIVLAEVDDDRQTTEVSRLMNEKEAVDLHERRAHWEEEGYSGFRDDRDLYSPEQVEEERHRVIGSSHEVQAEGERQEAHIGNREVSGAAHVHKPVIDIDELTEDVDSRYDYASFESDFHKHHERTFAARGGEFSDYAPAYRYGHAFGSSDAYAERDYEEVEPELRRSYESEYGAGSYDPYSDAARYAFNATSRRRS